MVPEDLFERFLVEAVLGPIGQGLVEALLPCGVTRLGGAGVHAADLPQIGPRPASSTTRFDEPPPRCA